MPLILADNIDYLRCIYLWREETEKDRNSLRLGQTIGSWPGRKGSLYAAIRPVMGEFRGSARLRKKI